MSPLLLSALIGNGFALPNEPLDRPYTQRNLRPAVLEEAYHGILRSSARESFVFPRPCSPASADPGCAFRYRLAYRDSAARQRLGFMPLAGAEYRHGEATAAAFEAGALGSGSLGPASFYLDARIFAENSGEDGFSYDREGFDRQEETSTGSIAYDSYARFRANFNVDAAFGRFTVARDAVHWGPGLLNNLVFHQDAVPFNHLVYTATLGPVKVVSLYGRLIVAPDYLDSLAALDRRIYAHRYELALGRDLLLGFSEQIVLFEDDNPFLFTPVFPLFIAKGFMHERTNNGNLALDAAWRIRRCVRLYGEFLLDDLESPTSLFTEDYAQNKWAAMAGVHAGREVAGMSVGAYLEYSHIEPFVYAHFTPFTAQTANLGYPLGNQQGPDSRSVLGRAYLRHPRGWYVGLQAGVYWKGTGRGSGVNDDAPDDALTPKEFLQDAVSEFRLSPTGALEWRTLGVYLTADLGDEVRAAAGFRAGY